MQMPVRRHYGNSAEFMAALNDWVKVDESAYQYLRGLYDAIKPFESKPDWIDAVEHVLHVDSSSPPANEEALEPSLRCLASCIMHKGLRPVRVAHGEFDEDGQHFWSVFAECEK